MNINKYPKDDPLENRIAAYGEIYTAPLTPVIHMDFPYNINARVVNDRSGGGGSVIQASGMAIIATSAAANASGVLQSRSFLRWNPGQGGLVRFSAFMTEGIAGSTQQIGIGDADSGFFFGYDGSSFGILHRHFNVDSWIPQASWNLDVMPDLDPTLGNVYQISYKLGFGQVVFSIEDSDTGEYIKVHRETHANLNQFPTSDNTNYPICILAHNIANTSNISISAFALGGFVEGNSDEGGTIYSSGVTGSISTVESPIMSFRSNATFLEKDNRAIVKLLRAVASNEGSQTIELRFILNGTLTGANFAQVDPETSVMSTDFSATAISNGSEITRGLVSAGLTDDFDLSNFEFFMDAGDIITIAGRKSSGAATDANIGMIWTERI